MDVDLSADGLRYVVQIWLVPTGHDDVRETSTVGCKQLLLDASDGEDLALQRHLASHTQSASDWPTGEQTGKRSHHGDTRRRAVLVEPCACALQRTGVDLGHLTEQRCLAAAGTRRNYDDSACDSAIERIQKSAAIGFRRVALVPQSEPSSAATTTLSAVDLSCTASLVLARAYSARTAGHVR